MESPLIKIRDKKKSFLLSDKKLNSVSKIHSLVENFSNYNTLSNTYNNSKSNKPFSVNKTVSKDSTFLNINSCDRRISTKSLSN
jgi:hypothetical protein